jgi:hypothetical protein
VAGHVSIDVHADNPPPASTSPGHVRASTIGVNDYILDFDAPFGG